MGSQGVYTGRRKVSLVHGEFIYTRRSRVVSDMEGLYTCREEKVCH